MCTPRSRPGSRHPTDVDELFARAITVDVAGLWRWCPPRRRPPAGPAIHGLMHSWSQVRYISDIDSVAAKVDDWDAVLRRARSANMLRALSVAILVSRELLATPLPPCRDSRGRRFRTPSC